MKVPNFINDPITNEKGELTDPWRILLSTLITQMQTHLSDEGIRMPQQSTDNINILETLENKGKVVYDGDTDELKVNINGTFKTINVT
jgi:hypothetical protein